MELVGALVIAAVILALGAILEPVARWRGWE